MLTIRLRRKGKKNQPFFRVIVIDKRRTAKGGNAVEIVGNIDPLTKKRNFKKDRILYWISKGAKPSASVHNLLVSEKIIDAKKINVSKKPARNASSLPASATPEALQTGIADAGGSKKAIEEEPATVADAGLPAESSASTPSVQPATPAAPEIKPAEPAPTEAPKEEVKPAEPAPAETPKEEVKLVEEPKPVEEPKA